MSRRGLLRASLALVGLFLSATLSIAGPLVQYDLTGAPGNQATQPATFTASGLTALAISRGAGLNAVAANNSFNSSGWNSLGATDYVELGFTVTGEPVFVDDFILATRSSNTGPGTIDVQVSIDGGAFTSLTTITQAPGESFKNLVLDVNLVANSSFVVRFFSANGIAANGGAIGAQGTWRLTNNLSGGVFTPVTLTGTAIPEPSTLLLGGVGLATLAGAAWRRRR